MEANVTDEELKRELERFGETGFVKITSKNRSIYIKKLNHLRAAERKANKSKPSRKLIGFSSDESGEDDPGLSARRRPSKGRGTPRSKKSQLETSILSPHSSLATSFSQNSSYNSGDEPSTASMGIQASFASNSSFDYTQTDEVSDSDDIYTTRHNTSTGRNNTDHERPNNSRSSTAYNDRKTVAGNQSGSRSYLQPRDTPKTSTPGGRLSLARRHIHPSDRGKTASQSSSERNFRSNNVKTPNSASSNHIKTYNELNEEESILKEAGFKTTEDPQSFNKYSQYISVVLLVLAALFFVVLASVYLKMTGLYQFVSTKEDTWLIEGSPGVGIDDPVYLRNEVVKARDLVIDLSSHLSKIAGGHECGSNNPDSTMEMSIKMFKQFVEQKYSKYEKEIAKIALQLILKNPQWMIRLSDMDGNTLNGSNLEEDYKSVYTLVTDNPDMGLWCRTLKAMTLIYRGIIISFLMTGTFLLIVTFMRYRWRKQEEETQMVFDMVEKVIDILKGHADNCQTDKSLQPYLAIPHVRDMLIAPADRRRMQGVWDRTVKFLSANESRLREETQTISGEDYLVWRWLQASCTNGGKVWQGQAFGENSDGKSLNTPPHCYTQCLKIRNMFDSDIEYGNEWHINIQDAILEKCGPDHGIVHIAVEKNSKEGCVYVKCTHPEAAGRAFRHIHGWWFDGNLVTVKYLRLERYHERFPDAAQANSALQPSTNNLRSLSQPYHRSSTELL